MLCLLLHATMSDIDECVNLELCSFYGLQYDCVNVPGEYYCDIVSVSDHKSRNKIIIIGMSFYLLRSTIIEKRFTWSRK